MALGPKEHLKTVAVISFRMEAGINSRARINCASVTGRGEKSFPPSEQSKGGDACDVDYVDAGGIVAYGNRIFRADSTCIVNHCSDQTC